MATPNSGVRVLVRPSSAVSAASSSSSHSLASSSSSSSSSSSPSFSSSSLGPQTCPPGSNPPLTPLRPWSSSLVPSCAKSSSSSSNSFFNSPPQAPSFEGVVVVGFIGRSFDDVSHLINRILDANVFGAGNLDRNLHPHLDDEENSSWFCRRRISYYHAEEKGIVFLQLSYFRCPFTPFNSTAKDNLDMSLEKHDFEDLRGMLLMFSVCHVIIFLNEGSRFDIQILKKFRMLQAAKNAMSPLVESHMASSLNLKTTSAQPTGQRTSSIGSPGRIRGIVNRFSSISLMSGSGSYPSLFPGQCTPVILFVFLDEFLDAPSHTSHVENLPDANLSSNPSGILRPSRSPITGSNSIVMLARSTNKTEGSFKKKLQSSLENQIRFLIKKCRTLSGMESSHFGSRGVNVSSALFSFDASKAVALLDKSKNHITESLDFTVGIIEDVLNQNVASDILFGNPKENSYMEDVLSIKEFIYRQSDTLRGRGGLATTANGTSASAVGMVAVAAAAAAASAASGKPSNTPPELPSLEDWLSCTQFILDALLSTIHGSLDENEVKRKLALRQNIVTAESGGILMPVADGLQAAISSFQTGTGLNMRFSKLWCQKALSTAKEVYLKDLPPCYPTSEHEAHLMKALQSFRSGAKGPALPAFLQNLEDECMSIWKSGRQLCDAISLTGKPCLLRRHNVESSHSTSEVDVKPHSSGCVFLHACACGRSRKIRDDPFDFVSANIKFNLFPNCENVLPMLELPKFSGPDPVMASSWSLIRLGSAKYYEPSKGLLYSGFCKNENFLQKWNSFTGKWIETKCLPLNLSKKGLAPLLNDVTHPKTEFIMNEEMKNTVSSQLFRSEVQTVEPNNKKNPLNISSTDERISFGTGLTHLSIKKPFSEVVAGLVASESTFPPLQRRKYPALSLEKSIIKKGELHQIQDEVPVSVDPCDPSFAANNSDRENSLDATTDGNPFLQIGSNMVPVNVNIDGNIKSSGTIPGHAVYYGLEHECSHGHRFLLRTDHLVRLGSPYSLTEGSDSHASTEDCDTKADNLVSFHKNNHKMVHPHSCMSYTKEAISNKKQLVNGSMSCCISGKEGIHSSEISAPSVSVNSLGGSLYCSPVEHEECAFSILDKKIPVYMDCPHCRKSKKQKANNIKFANTVSQLQRIFMVTPPFPVVLATAPVVQFEHSCLPPSIPNHDRKSQFSLGCRVILPPESFLTLRLPFIYGVQMEDGSLHPLNHLEHQPERTAWVCEGTILQIVSKGDEILL